MEVCSEDPCGPLLKTLSSGGNYRVPCQVKACFIISFITFSTRLYCDGGFSKNEANTQNTSQAYSQVAISHVKVFYNLPETTKKHILHSSDVETKSV